MSKSRRRERRIRVVGTPRKEPDVRRIAKAIVALSLDIDETDDRFAELLGTEHAISRRRKSAKAERRDPDEDGQERAS